MAADFRICEYCCGDDKIGELTPIHVSIKGIPFTWYFHNRKDKPCLTKWIREQRFRFNASNTN